MVVSQAEPLWKGTYISTRYVHITHSYVSTALPNATPVLHSLLCFLLWTMDFQRPGAMSLGGGKGWLITEPQ